MIAGAETLPAAIGEVVAAVRSKTAPGGRDRQLLDGQQFLSFATQAALYALPATAYTYVPGARPRLEAAVSTFADGCRPGLATALALTQAVSRLTEAPLDGRDRTEEAVLESRTATTIERARLLAALAQVAGIGSRICFLYRTEAPVFHAVCELQIMGAWSVFDPLANVCFVMGHHPYASAWDLNRMPAVVDRHPAHAGKWSVASSLYRTVGISHFRVRFRNAPSA